MTSLKELFESELGYVVLLFGLFVVPRILQRWRIPTGITSFALGATVALTTGLLHQDQTLKLLATFGIVSLFLFAGLDVDLGDLRKNAAVVAQHLVIRLLLLVAVAFGAGQLLSLERRPAILFAMAVLIPSAGFILDSLAGWGLNPDERFWVKTKVIATELLALGLLFVTLQSTGVARLGLSSLALVAMIAILPFLFRIFALRVVPWAPNSEFAFLLMMAIVVAYATRQLGVYYLVGAFVVGVSARRFRETLPALASDRMLHAVEVFSSFFAPFYFFVAGTQMRLEYFSGTSLLYGVALAATVLPLRLAAVMLNRRISLRETTAQSVRVALPMLPTLVLTLVIAGILRDDFDLPASLFGALIVYTIINTMLPALLLRGAPVADSPKVVA